MFTPLAQLPQRTQHRTHGAGLPAESPEQELAQDRIPAPTGNIASCILVQKGESHDLIYHRIFSAKTQ